MTNAEKYLKDGVDVKQFAEMIDTAYIKADSDADVCESTINWLKEQAKPTLTEDERVILKNIAKDYSKVFRNGEGRLFFYNQKRAQAIDNHKGVFNHLFQFIKNGEEYEIAELLKGE